MPRRIAVVFVHGVEINDPGFADNAIARLKRSFARQLAGANGDAAEALVIRPVFWAPVLDPYEDRLLERAFQPRAKGLFDTLTTLVTRINGGSQTALLPFLLSSLFRSIPGIPQLHYPTLRWLVTSFVGDAVGYQLTPSDRTLYDAVHRVFARTLRELTSEAGEDAPLCIIAHSLGTVFASNYFYDLASEREGRKPLVATAVRELMQETPLERGETLLDFYTLGSPLALWTLRYPDFGVPIRVPSPLLAAHHPSLRGEGEWVNYHDRDDLIAYPLKRLSPLYAEAVTHDREVSVGPFWVSWNPLVHPWYWNDDAVIDPIAASLARSYRLLNPD